MLVTCQLAVPVQGDAAQFSATVTGFVLRVPPLTCCNNREGKESCAAPFREDVSVAVILHAFPIDDVEVITAVVAVELAIEHFVGALLANVNPPE